MPVVRENADQGKSYQQWLNKLEREIMWMRARLSPMLPIFHNACSHREICICVCESRAKHSKGTSSFEAKQEKKKGSLIDDATIKFLL